MGKGAYLMSIFWGFLITSAGIFYVVITILLNNYGTKINAKIITYEPIFRDYFHERCNISYNIDGKIYNNWVVVKESDISNEEKEIEITVLKKYPKIVMNSYQQKGFFILIFSLFILIGIIIMIKNIYNLI